MKRWIDRLASTKIAIVAFIAIVLAFAAGTIIESSKGSEAAAHTVYGALWFRALLPLFAANVVFSLKAHRHRILFTRAQAAGKRAARGSRGAAGLPCHRSRATQVLAPGASNLADFSSRKARAQ